MVTYGGMSRKPITVPTSLFIFKDISLRGFWMTRWHADHSTQERREFFAEMTKVILGDHNDPPFVVPTQDYAISDYAAAIEVWGAQKWRVRGGGVIVVVVVFFSVR